ncbi:MAG: EamA family transporter [Kordiimonadaceae bacterium]|nr:EamA family transporter [Kordiimonadaceae bacterium]
MALVIALFFRSLVFVFSKYAALETTNTGLITILTSHWYWAELLALSMQAVFWAYALKRLTLNIAYPFMSMIYSVNLTWAWYLFDETITPYHLTGCLLIIIGVLIASLPQRTST